MERTFCKYHPTKPALWYCERCNAYYCPECITERSIDGGYNKKGVMYVCPNCSSLPEKLAAQNIVEPFWNRLPKFFTYPLNPSTIIFMLVLSGLMTLFSVPGLLSGLLLLMLLGALLKYCLAALKRTASGNMSPPPIDENTIQDDFFITIKFLILVILYGLAVLPVLLLSMRFSLTMGIAVSMLFFNACIIGILFIFPASVIILTVNESFLDAINPMITVRMAFRIGRSYTLMFFFIVILYVAPGIVGYLIHPYLPSLLFYFIYSMAICYYFIVMCHLMGYVILQHHDDIGYDVQVETKSFSRNRKDAHAGEQIHGLLSRVNVLIKEGKHSEAISLIEIEAGDNITDLPLAERFYNLLKIEQKVSGMLWHAKRYLDLLIKAGRVDSARAVYLECVAADPSFSPSAPVLFKVASSMNETGNFHAALEAYNRFIKNAPGDPMVPKAYLLAAAVFDEKMLSPEKAVKTLKRLIHTFPESEITPYAQKYLRQIESRV